MRQPFSLALQARRTEALQAAEKELEKQGFTRFGDRDWRGCVPGTTEKVRVSFPEQFPHQLPSIHAKPRKKVTPHIAADGKLCLIAPTGQLIDESRPVDIIRDVLSLAAQILTADPSDFERETILEYQMYWALGGSGGLLLLSPVPGKNTSLVYGHFIGDERRFYIAQDERSAEAWAARTDREISDCKPAIFVRLEKLPTPPSLNSPLKLKKLIQIVEKARGDAQSFRKNLEKFGLPTLCLFGVDGESEDEKFVFGAYVSDLTGAMMKEALKGWRLKTLTPKRKVKFALNQPVEKLAITRADYQFAIIRGGSKPRLSDMKIGIVGCGAIGSHLASSLAEAGFSLLLTDHEKLEPANVHRHLLGMDQIGSMKADAVKDYLLGQYPHLSIESYPCKIEDVFEAPVCALDSVDLIVMALGDPTLELLLNEYLGSSKKRIHAWLEPLGLGGHVLVTGSEKPGCFSCLYRPDETFGLVCRADLSAWGQSYLAHYAGCSGAFTPFSGLDARQAALNTVRCVISSLEGNIQQPTLLSWMGDSALFKNKGYELSRRGMSFEERTEVWSHEFVRPACPHCSAAGWRA